MSRPVYSAHCPGCSRRIHAPSETTLLRHHVRHLRNCASALKLIGEDIEQRLSTSAVHGGGPAGGGPEEPDNSPGNHRPISEVAP